ncbi:MAG: GntR family transcriptional regulator [Pseudomonadota bacterium]
MKLINIHNQESNEDIEDKGTLADSIRRTLADEIFSGEIKINHRLDEQELADRFKVSRTPVREALRQLATAGLVEIKPRRGATVVPLDPEIIGQAFEAAAELEALSAGKAAMRASLSEMVDLQALLEACEAAVSSESAEHYSSANREFHDKIGELSGNASLMAATRIVRIQTAPYQRAQFSQMDERRQSQSEHEQILNAICRQDSEAAAQAMKEHILRASLYALSRQRTEGNDS